MDLLTRLKDIEVLKQAGEMQIGAGEHLGVTFHRLTFAIQPPEATAVFGDNVGLTLGMGSTAIWGVIGGEESLATLKGVMDKLEAATQSPTDVRTPPSFRVIVNVNQLVEMAETAQVASQSRRAEREAAAGAEAALELQIADGSAPAPGGAPAPAAGGPGRGQGRGRGFRGGPNAARMAQRAEQGGRIARETLKEGDDRIEIDTRLTETGARSRVRLEQGFVKIFGRLVANALGGGDEPANDATPAAPAAPTN
jgi:hypothetical protein